jgi:type IV pilus assembly protein PilE
MNRDRHEDNRDMHHASQSRRAAAGFTLIELMIVVAVIGILAVIALPAFQDSIRKSRRADAMAGLSQLQQLQERFRGNNPAYASNLASLPGGGVAESPERHYTLAIPEASASSYKLTATAKATSPQFADAKCRRLQVEMTNGTPTPSSFDAADVADTTNANRCWVR